MEKAGGEPSAPFISGAAWNLPSPHIPPSWQRCWLTSHQWGVEGSFLPCQSWPYKAQHGLQALAASLPPFPPSLPAFLLQSLGQHPGIASAPRRCKGGLVGWASSFSRQMNLMGRMCLQNTLSVPNSSLLELSKNIA